MSSVTVSPAAIPAGLGVGFSRHEGAADAPWPLGAAVANL